ncbi:helix-turn-helix transcriptional regulator [Paenibacillus sp. YN15]|uniref:helix-turn-helix transcriptional regulator n=1 Tax=Paenibacillus sp. YN15 TaxID=1742774 RepID=UPI0015EBEC8B|nr:helix-turn-helix transcriptional regulator [Paenibacillus sp. YN15]
MAHLWNPEVKGIIHRVAEPPWRLNRFVYGSHAFCYIVEGGPTFTLNQADHPAQAGALFSFMPGDALEIGIREHTEFFTIHFSLEPSLEPGENGRQERPFGIQTAVVQTPFMRRCFQDAWRLWSAKGVGYEWKCKILLMQIMDMLMDQTRAKAARKLLLVDQAISCMNRHTSAKLTLDQLGSHTGVSPSYLSRVFHELTGMSPIAYFNRIKMDEAKELLLSTHLTVKEVAHKLGFADEFYFSRLFKHTVGAAPSEYRGRE